MSERDDLGELLQRIAATVGDPPEHGLDRVDARRRRRTRHRRGAVAAAVALAVSAVGVAPWLVGLGEGTNVATGRSGGDEVETSLPDYVQVNCGPAGLEIPVGSGSIQTGPDGMQLRIHNAFPHDTAVWVRGSGGWDSGRVMVKPGDDRLRQAVPPGDVTVGCDVGGEPREATVILNDERHYYDKPELSCPEDKMAPPLPPGRFEPTNSTFQAGERSMGNLWREGDQVEPVNGYQDTYHSTAKTRIVGIERDDEVLAFVYLHDETPDDELAADPPWAGFIKVEYCLELAEDGSPTETTTTSVTSPPPS